jgi:hypothetical protein
MTPRRPLPLLAAALAAAITAALAGSAAFASPAASPPLDCRAVEAIGNAMRDEVITAIERDLVGEPIEISRRKTLHLLGVDDVQFRGCRLRAKVLVDLERKIRRDAEGHAWVSGTVQSYGLRPQPWVCLDRKPQVDRVELRHTANLGERLYARIAQRTLAPDRCFPVGIAP